MVNDMPVYAYKCADDKCAETFEKTLPVTEFDSEQPCPTCGAASEKRINGVGFVLRGDAWPVSYTHLTLPTKA